MRLYDQPNRLKGLLAQILSLTLLLTLLSGAASAQLTQADRNLIHGLISNQPKQVEIALRAGANPNISFEQKDEQLDMLLWPALVWAAERGQVVLVRQLLAKGARVNASNSDGKTALHVAAEKGFEPLVKLLLEKGADINALDREDQSPLNLALDSALFHFSFLFNSDNPEPYLKAAKRLIQRGAKRVKRDSRDYDYLHEAVEYRHFDMVKMLVDSGYDLNVHNREGETPLNLSIFIGLGEMTQYLINKGAHVNQPNQNGLTPIMQAILKYHWKLVDQLLKKGASVNAQTQAGESALSLAARSAFQNDQKDFKELDTLFAHSRDVNDTLRSACLIGDLQRVKQALTEGAELNAENRVGQTPLAFAVMSGHSRIVNWLLTQGADPNLPDKLGQTPLILAALHSQTAVLRQLISQGAHIDDQAQDGSSALMWAAITRNLALINLLVNHDANANLRDNHGKSALDYAKESHFEAGVQELTTRTNFLTKLWSRLRFWV